MHIIKTRIKINEDKVEAFVDHLGQKAAEIKQEFAGCHHFELLANTNSKTSFLLYEEWASHEACMTLRQSDFFKQIGATVFPMMSSPMEQMQFSAEIFNA